MICIMIRLFEIYFRIVSGDFLKFPIDVLPEFCSDYFMSVFGREYYMVVAEVNTVTIPSILLYV
jgi:hypothetical protein